MARKRTDKRDWMKSKRCWNIRRIRRKRKDEKVKRKKARKI